MNGPQSSNETFECWEDYFIPGTQVLKNKFGNVEMPYGETNSAKLQALEEFSSHLRMQELFEKPIDGHFDYDHMKAIHFHLF